MSDELRFAVAALLSLLAAWVLVPAAVRVAVRTDFLDRPRGHKVHARAVPYLGGCAVMVAFLVGCLAIGGGLERFWPLLAGAAVLCAVGTVDDRVGVAPKYRIAVELALALLLTITGTGWTFTTDGVVQFVLNAAWIVGFVNAFNLFDNMDGAAASLGAVCAGGLSAFAIVQGDWQLAAITIALAAACAGFLRYNLFSGGRARIFLGDGGSMPLGFLIAAFATRLPDHSQIGWPLMLTAGLLLAVPTLDTLLVVISRSRRGIALTTGGQDHLTHRLDSQLASPRAVAAVVVGTQAMLSAAAILSFQAGRTAVLVAGLGAIAGGFVLVALLDRAPWAPPAARPQPAPAPVDMRPRLSSAAEQRS